MPEVLRRKCRTVRVGPHLLGGGNPVRIQTMWKEPLKTLDAALLEGIEGLGRLGCELLRFAIPDLESAGLLGELAARVSLPLVADIHFDHRLALRCLDFPVAKIRINPGNIGASWKVEEVVRKAGDKGVAIRVGINSGSLPPALRDSRDPAEAMVRAAELELDILERLGFRDVVFSLKSSDLESTLESNRRFARRFDFPLHLGLTEAGPLIPGLVKSTLALGGLLQEGIGDTVRVSLADGPAQEILAARSILSATGVRRFGVELIACPTCGRTAFDVKRFYEQVAGSINAFQRPVTIALMGCPVNGPGEARHADLGVTGSRNSVLFFKKGRVIRRVSADRAVSVFEEELRKL